MYRILAIGLETIAAAILLLPLLLLLHHTLFHNSKRTTGYALLSLYLAAIYAAVGLPSVQSLSFDPSIQLIPFAGMSLEESLLNVLLFLPLGGFLPLLWEKFRSFPTTLLFAFLLSLLIEVLQIFTFRATDINDLITNTLGAAIGYGIVNCLPLPSAGPLRDLPLLGGLVFLVMFFLQPWVSSLLWTLFL